MVISLPKVQYTQRIYMVLANPTYTVYECMYGDFPAKSTVYAT